MSWTDGAELGRAWPYLSRFSVMLSLAQFFLLSADSSAHLICSLEFHKIVLRNGVALFMKNWILLNSTEYFNPKKSSLKFSTHYGWKNTQNECTKFRRLKKVEIWNHRFIYPRSLLMQKTTLFYRFSPFTGSSQHKTLSLNLSLRQSKAVRFESHSFYVWLFSWKINSRLICNTIWMNMLCKIPHESLRCVS